MRFQLVFLFLLCISLLVVNAKVESETIRLNSGESIELNGKNITLVDSNDDAVVICINRKKTIMSKSGFFNGVTIKLLDKDEDKAKFRFEVRCKDDCGCDENECDNSVCLFKPTTTETTTIETAVPETSSTISSTIPIATTIETKITEQQTLNQENLKFLTYGLGIIAFILLIAFLLKKIGSD